MNFLFTCGGTGGHINPAIAVADRLKELFPESAFLFVGGDDTMELELVPKAGYSIKSVTASNLHRSIKPVDIIHNIRAAGRIAHALGQSKKIIKDFKPHIVIGTGGYVCYPVLRMAKQMGIPTLVHESNAVPGLTTRLLEKHVDKVLIGFEESLSYYKDPNKVKHTGTPVRSEFRLWNKDIAKSHLGVDKGFFALSLWGSLGALYMNEITAELIVINEKEGSFKHIHSTGGGEKGLEKMLAQLSELGVNELKHTDLRHYIYDMPMVMAAADLVICRGGACTLNELAALGKPAIIVPSAYVTGNHQEKNARVVEGRGGAIVIKEADCSARILYDTIYNISKDEEHLIKMSKAMTGMDSPRATDRIVDMILSLLNKTES